MFFIRWEVQSRCREQPSRLQTPGGRADHAHLAIDGKTLRATRSLPRLIHQLSCYEVGTGIVLWPHDVGKKESEISVLKPLLTSQMVKGRIFPWDAMHTQRGLCAQIHRLHGDYLLIAKDNQPTLREDIADLFEDPAPDRQRWQQAETWDKAHGRIEHRHVTCSPDLNDWFGKQWEGIEHVFRIERIVQSLKTGNVRHEVVSGISSLSMKRVPPQRLLRLNRDHWGIENRLHYRRDVALAEDACQVRKGTAPHALAVLDSFLLALFDCGGVTNVKQQMRRIAAQPLLATQLLLTSLAEK